MNSVRKKINKTQFKCKKDINGLILTVHNTTTEDEKIVRIRLINACFNNGNTHFIAIDHRGNIFVFDIVTKKFWKLIDKVPRCSVICNSNNRECDYLIGTKDGELYQIDIDSGLINNLKKFCDSQIISISNPTDSMKTNNNFIVHTDQNAYLIDFITFKITFKLQFNNLQHSLKFVSYIPNSNQILTCFTNDSIHIWSNINTITGTGDSNWNTTRIIRPVKLRDRKLKLKEIPELTLSNELDIKFNNNDLDRDIHIDEIKDFTKGLINSYSFSNDCQFICLTTLDNFIIILCSKTFDIMKIIHLKNFNFIQCCCYSLNGFGGKLSEQNDLFIFGLTSQTSDVVLIDCNDLLVKALVQNGNSYKMNISKDGKMLFVILKSGEINVYQTSKVLNIIKTTQKSTEIIKKTKSIPFRDGNDMHITNELKRTLNRERLIPILNEYGGYTEKYRPLIWSTLLELPNNKSEFLILIKKGIHPICHNYDKKFPLKDSTLLRNLKKIISCICYWSTVFSHCEYLPKFIFPFIQIYPNNLLLTFELCITILLNYCQLWFEFIPMEPLNYLGIIENILNYYDSKLLQFYYKKNITSKLYAWQLLSTGFSEVLDNEQWYHLWDNIISSSNNISYLIYCVIAYQIIQRNVIMRLQTIESIEQFFHEQNIIDMKRFLYKINYLIKNCPIELNPIRYLKKFEKLPNNFYPKFENYPKEWIQLKDKELNAIQLENEFLNMKMRDLEQEEYEMAKKLEQELKDEEHNKRLKELDKLYYGAISREEERIACQRKMLLVYKKEIRNRKGKILELVNESEKRKKINQVENDLDKVMRFCERGRQQDETEMMFAEEDLKDHELNLLTQKYKEKSINNDYDFLYKSRFKNTIKKFQNDEIELTNKIFSQNVPEISQQNLNNHNKNFNDDNTSAKMNKISAIENQLENIQIEFQRTIESKFDNGKEQSKTQMHKHNNDKQTIHWHGKGDYFQ